MLALASTPVLCRESQLALSCETAKVERTALGQAPKGARRVEKHVLEVITAKGAKRFVDKPSGILSSHSICRQLQRLLSSCLHFKRNLAVVPSPKLPLVKSVLLFAAVL
jgi:hypothetical protein